MISSEVGPMRSVRWPFRILAAIIVVACALVLTVFAIGGGPHGTTLPKWQSLAALPGTAWLARLAWYAAIRGRAPATASWPFASEGVLIWYTIALPAVSHF